MNFILMPEYCSDEMIADVQTRYKHDLNGVGRTILGCVYQAFIDASEKERGLKGFGASDAACYLYPGEDQAKERAAYCAGAAIRPDIPYDVDKLIYALEVGRDWVRSLNKITERGGDPLLSAMYDMNSMLLKSAIRDAEVLDACQVCHGKCGGTPGNENIIDNVVMCDYCSAARP